MSNEKSNNACNDEDVLKVCLSETSKTASEIHDLFLKGKEKLRIYDEIKKTRPLTKKEQILEGQIKYGMYLSIEKYAKKIVGVYTTKYMLDSDAETEMMNNISDKFIKLLGNYDPNIISPTSYFKYHFVDTARSYITENVLNVTLNDYSHLKALEKAIKECEEQGIKCDIQNEENEMLHKLISETLSPDEIEFFFTYLNIGEAKVKDYKELMAIYNMLEHEVKSKISNIQAKLMLELNSNREKSKIQLSLHDNDTLKQITGMSYRVIDKTKRIFNSKVSIKLNNFNSNKDTSSKTSKNNDFEPTRF